MRNIGYPDEILNNTYLDMSHQRWIAAAPSANGDSYWFNTQLENALSAADNFNMITSVSAPPRDTLPRQLRQRPRRRRRHGGRMLLRFADDCLQQGTLTMANGDCFEGTFDGSLLAGDLRVVRAQYTRPQREQELVANVHCAGALCSVAERAVSLNVTRWPMRARWQRRSVGAGSVFSIAGSRTRSNYRLCRRPKS